MAYKKPLANYNGELQEIGGADQIDPSLIPAGSSTVTVYVDQTPDNGSYGLLAGSVNGSNAVFTVSRGSYLTGSLQVYRNGQLLTQGSSNDFTETAPNSGTFTFVTAPLSGDVITAVYQLSVVSLAGGNLSGSLNFAKGSDIAAAATTDIGSATGNYVVVTGTATITALGTAQAGTRRLVRFTGECYLVNNNTSLILPGGDDYTTDIGDLLEFTSEGSGNWRLTGFLSSQISPPNFYGVMMARMSGNIMF